MAVLDELPDKEALEALQRIEHIVVVMMENRSFDHMLGYLRLAGRDDVDGLKADMANRYGTHIYRVFPLDRTDCEPWEDPDHSGEGVETQMRGDNNGFVKSYVESRPREKQAAVAAQPEVFVMGYYEADDVRTYDHLATHFCVCDRWFASVPGATWPNRLYALCGQSGGRKDNKKLFGKLDWPLHHYPSFVRELDTRNVDWRWYHARSADLEPPTIAVADMRYLVGHSQHLALFDQAEPVTGEPSFLDDARNGSLPSVAWIDPDFGVTKRGAASDDHPPADVTHGQAFIRQVYNAVIESPTWERTLLIITYDEHGGFFDHVVPPPAPDDEPHMRRYGIRVPALIVSPLVEAGIVAHSMFDHTSIIKTIFQRFCRDERGELPFLGTRVALARHLGSLLTAQQPRSSAMPIPETLAPRKSGSLTLELKEQQFLAMPRVANTAAEPLIAAMGGPTPSNDLQLGMVRAGLERQELRETLREDGPPDVGG
jgi:phospholipase C